jgi:hypothetical protein
MNPDGQIYHISEDNPDKEKIFEELELIEIPEEEYPTVSNMSEIEKKAWYQERKRQFKAA